MVNLRYRAALWASGSVPIFYFSFLYLLIILIIFIMIPIAKNNDPIAIKKDNAEPAFVMLND